MKIQLKTSYEEVISRENLFAAWQEFVFGKKNKKDVQEFSLSLADNILQLQSDLANFSYIHGDYKAFNITDPKPRNIHKAQVRDRVLHHAIYRKLYPFFDRTFIADSYSCRVCKGTHKAIKRFESFALQVSKNHTKTAWVLKCDIRKFFASIDHFKLQGIITSYIPDKNVLWLLQNVINSFNFVEPKKGLPLGNLTSQLFCNIYMNEFDQFVKHKLKIRHYIRYADDFVFLSQSKNCLLGLLPKISDFLNTELKLALHPDKVFIKTLSSGVDFLGWIVFPKHKVLRTTSRKRMFNRLKGHPTNETMQSYLGMLKHGNTHKIKEEVLNTFYILGERGI